MMHDSTNPAGLCLLCRSNHCQTVTTKCLAARDSTCESIFTSIQSFSSIPRSKSRSSSDTKHLTPRHRTRAVVLRGQNSHGTSTFLWLLALTTVLAVSSAVSIQRNRGGPPDPHNGITGRDKAIDYEAAAADEYLEKFGYYGLGQHQQADVNHDGDGTSRDQQLHVLPGQHSEADREKAVRRLQRFFHLPASGQLDEQTEKIMSASRCGMQDITDDDYEKDEVDEEYDNKDGNVREKKEGELVTDREIMITFPEQKKRKKRFAVQRYSDGKVYKWRTDSLSWRLEEPSSQLSHSEQKAAIRRAFDLWRQVIPIEISEHVGNTEADIRIRFARRQHGPSPDPVFDGKRLKSNTLAHAWGPNSRTAGLPGDVHFDEDDDWSKSNELFIVAVHELGHSFGLLHSDDRASIMFPVYQTVTKLGLDDLNAVDYLYGPGSDQSWRTTKVQKKRPKGFQRKHFTVRPEWVTRPTPRGVNTCDNVVVNAFLPDPAPQSKNYFIAVSGDRVHRLSPRGEILQTEPLHNVFPDLPQSPDIGLSVVQEQKIFFIKGDSMWAYKEGELLEGFPRSINEMGFPEQPKFSISLVNSDGNDWPLLFGESYWWMFDSKEFTARQHNRISAFSRDLPKDILFVAQWSDRRLYAVTNNSYVVLDSIQRLKTHKNSSIAGKPDWLIPLCMEIKKLPPESDNTTAIVLSCLIGCFILIIAGIFVYRYVKKRFF